MSQETTHVSPRTYVLDTSVLLSDPQALFAFEEHHVVLPIVVIKELEAKRTHPVLGFNARSALRALERLRVAPGNDLRKGVPVTQQGGTLRVEINHVDSSHLPAALQADGSNDARILTVADALSRDGQQVIVVSKDLPLRLLSHSALGIEAQEYRREQVDGEQYMGVVSSAVAAEVVDALFRDHQVAMPVDLAWVPVNTGVIAHAGSASALARVTSDGDMRLVHGDMSVFGLRGRSAEQRVALDHLMNEDIPIVSLGGQAGTGKSVLALAAALEAVLERRTHRRILVFRPILAVGGQDLGFLPGSEEEKMSPWAAAVFDALRAITTDEVIDEIRDRGVLEILPLTHIRGRTLGPRDIVIVDEVQNLERSVILAAITRLGEGSRMFLLHDVAQRDNLRVGRYDGIATVIERLKGEPLFAHINLVKSERSPAAALAARLLDDGSAR